MSDINLTLPNLTYPYIQKGTLYIVATPIGNLGDITLRALHTLHNVDFIFCEDTRVTNRLLTFYGLKASLFMYHDHSDAHDREHILKCLRDGSSVALVSDAGTPLISDPGYKVVVDCHEQGFPLTLIPGPCALINGLVLSGLPTDQFYFGGFLPLKMKDREEKLLQLLSISASLIFYETGPKLLRTLQDFLPFFKNRKLVIARELTKKFETIHQGTVTELCDFYHQAGPPKGELVLIMEGHSKSDVDSFVLDPLVCKNLLEKYSLKDTAEILSIVLSQPKNTIYQSLLKFKNEAR
ncbi:MAG: 16S rRNA (cytidine(1402)-2'-O)-methyltransferase [Alphaproteobacteria bacterium]